MKVKLTVERQVELNRTEDGNTIGEAIDEMIYFGQQDGEMVKSVSVDLDDEYIKLHCKLIDKKKRR